VSISLQVAPVVRPFRGFADPALPDGYWVTQAGVLGDASGGVASIDIRFSTVAQPNVSLLYNLEQLMVAAPAAEGVIRLDFGGFDLQPLQGSTGSVSKLVALFLTDFSSVTASALQTSNLLGGKPIFMGSPRKDVNVDLSFDFTNANGANFAVFAQGFFWGPASINAPGGPQRPLTSVYGG